MTRTRHWNHGLTRSYIDTKFIQALQQTTPSSTLSRNINSRHSFEGQPNDVDGFCSVRLPHDVPQQSIWLIGQWQRKRQPQANILTREPSQLGEAIYHFPCFGSTQNFTAREWGTMETRKRKHLWLVRTLDDRITFRCGVKWFLLISFAHTWTFTTRASAAHLIAIFVLLAQHIYLLISCA